MNLCTNFAGFIYEDMMGNIWLSTSELNGQEMMLSRYDGKSFTKIASNTQVFVIFMKRSDSANRV